MTPEPRATVHGLRVAALGAVLSLVVVGFAGVWTAPAASAADTACDPNAGQPVAQTPPALARLGADKAWTLATGKGVVVAVVDSGVDAGNAHLGSVVLAGTDTLGPAGNSAGRVDEFGHGTAIAGEIAARQVPGSGVVGLAKDATILAVRVFHAGKEDIVAGAPAADAGADTGQIAAGIRYAAEHGAKIINVSMSSTIDDRQMTDAVAAATAAGALVVASAGNRLTTQDTADSPRYPAASDGVLAVTAVNAKDAVTDASIHGAHVDVAAPGTDVLTSYFGTGDCMLAQTDASTSFATAYVSAAAALVAERFPDETPAQWAYRLEVTASRAIVGKRDDFAGWGVIRPYAALSFVDDGSAPGPVSPVFGAVPPPQAPAPAIHVGVLADPLAPAKSIASWWVLGGGTVLVGSVLVSRLKPRRRRR